MGLRRSSTTLLESNIKVMRVKEMIINWRPSWFLDKFSLPAHYEMYKEQYGEYP